MCGDRSVFLSRVILIVVDDPFIVELDGAGTLAVGASESGGRCGAQRGIVGCMERSIGRIAEHTEEITESRFAIVLDNEYIIVAVAFEQISIDAVESRIVVWHGIGEGLEIFGDAVPHTVAGVRAQRIGSRVVGGINLR